MTRLAPMALAAAFVAFLPSFQEPPAKQEKHDATEHADTPLAQQMVKIDDAMHFLRRSLKEPAQDEQSLAQVVLAEQACLAAKSLAPRMTVHVAEAERAAFQKEYRKGVAAMLVEWVRLETALLDGDRDAAQASWKKLDRMEEEGHDRFTEGE